MGRIATWAVVGIVAAIVVAAAADALRTSESTASALRRADVAGRLVVSDARCRRSELQLPELRRANVAGPRICATLHAGRLPRSCRVNYADRIAAAAGTVATVVAASCAPGLFRSLRTGLGRRCRRLEVESVAWPAPSRVAAIARCEKRGGASEELLAVFHGRRRVVWKLFRHAELSDLRASPRGSFLAARVGGERLLVLDARGLPVSLPTGVRGAQAIAWSPDERWTVAATGDALLLFPTREPGARLIRLHLPAVDVAWP